MPASYLEIVQLSNGDYALQRADGDGDSLVRISFSREAQEVLQQHSTTVVRAMISAAIQTVSNLGATQDMADEIETMLTRSRQPSPTIHAGVAGASPGPGRPLKRQLVECWIAVRGSSRPAEASYRLDWRYPGLSG